MTSPLIAGTEQRDYQKLFLLDLNWSRPDQPPITYEHEGRPVTATNVSSYRGLRVWVVNEKPNSALEAALDQHLAKTSTDRILIFHDDTEQVWRWPVRRAVGTTTSTRLSRHKHRNGDPDPRFAAKLDVIQLPLDVVLDSNTVLARVREAFDVEAQNETKYASKLMARLYAAMEKAYPIAKNSKVRDHEISVTLARILFLMFGDDTDMWPEGRFQDFILDHTSADGSDIGERLTELFAYLDTHPTKRGNVKPEFDGFRYVNGGIFEERLILPAINAEFRAAVLEACDRDWKTISPAIFGSMFQSVRDAKTRRELGEHYTSEENILKTLNPLFLDELRAEFEHIKTLGKYEADRLRKLRDRLGRIRFMDPACGCGNFIIVAYRELRDLELAIMERLQEITGDGAMLLANAGLMVSLDHFYGIEIDEWPARIAETAMFLIDRQCDLKLTERLGLAPDRLPIQEQATIVVGNALRTNWNAVCPSSDDVIIAGNPPFIGARLKSSEQGFDLETAWGGDYNGDLDYVTGWHAKALDYLNDHDARWAFVTTNSITQGQAAAALFGPIHRRGWTISFAHRTFPWTSEAAGKAAVHCVIVGFCRDPRRRRLFTHEAGHGTREVEARSINAYLVDGPWVLVDKRNDILSPSLTRCDFGSMANDGGHLIVEQGEYATVKSDPLARKYLRRFVGSEELVNAKQRWCLWLVDAEARELEESPVLHDRIVGVYAHRMKSKREATRRLARVPQLFAERRQPESSYLCIPRVVSESRPFFTATRFGSDVVASDAVFTVEDRDGFLFGVVASSMFITWQRTVGGRLKSDPRFSNTIVWNNLPLPLVSSELRTRIASAGQEVERARQKSLGASLADLYDPKRIPAELVDAHGVLDALVDQAFGAKRACRSELERLQILFARYEELSLH